MDIVFTQEDQHDGSRDMWDVESDVDNDEGDCCLFMHKPSRENTANTVDDLISAAGNLDLQHFRQQENHEKHKEMEAMQDNLQNQVDTVSARCSYS